MNANLLGAIAVALVLGACGAKQDVEVPAEEPAAPAQEVTPAPEATDPAMTDPATGEIPADPNAAPTDPAAEEVPPAQ
jgi:hypothetical protein